MYRPITFAFFRRTLTLLKGIKPENLPVEQPSKIEFVINLATAKKLGVKIPQELLLRADAQLDR